MYETQYASARLTEALATLHMAAQTVYEAKSGPETLQRLRIIRRLVDDAQTAAVDLSRAEGHSWDWIGFSLGISKQAAHSRYSDDEVGS